MILLLQCKAAIAVSAGPPPPTGSCVLGEDCKMKKQMAWLVMLALLLTLFSGVSVMAEGTAEEPVEVVLWGIDPMAVGAGNQEMLDAMAKALPHIRVTPQTMPASGGYDTQDLSKFTAAIAAGNPPDVAVLNGPFIMEVAARDALTPLNEYLDAIGFDISSEYYEYTVREMTFQDKIWGLPSGVDDRVLYWNKAAFEAAGLDPEQPPKTWDELLEYAEKLTIKDDKGNFQQIGFIPNFGNSWLYLYATQNGGKFLSDDGRTCTLDAQENIEALEFMVKGYDLLGGAELVNAYQASFQGGADSPFLTGQVAMVIDGNWFLSDLARYNPELNYGVTMPPTPKGDNYLTWSGGWAYGVAKGAKHPKEAVEVMRYLTTEGVLEQMKGQKAFNDENGYNTFPSLCASPRINNILYETYVKDFPVENVRNSYEFCVSALENTVCLPVSPVGQLLWSEHARAIDEAIYHQSEPADIMKKATEKVQRELDKFWSSNESF